MSESPIPKISACPSERSRSGRRHSYTSYCDKDMQYAFRRSLASIHFDCPPGRMRRSKHHSMADYCDSSTRRVAISDQSKIQDFEMTNSKPRRASMNDLSACAEPQRVSEFSPCSTFEKDGAIIQGILRVPKKNYVLQGRTTTHASPKVSFECHKDGILKRSVSFYTVDSWSLHIDTSSIDVVECNSNCVQVMRPKKISSLGHQIKNLRSLIQSIQQSDLNIPTSSDTSSAPGYLERRHSMLDLGQTGQQHRQDRHRASPTAPRVSCPSPQRRSSDGDSGMSYQPCCVGNNHQSAQSKEVCHPVKYVLGDMVRSSSHMTLASCPQDAAKNASNLKDRDFAFVKRTDGSWTFAILACRLFLESHNKQADSHEECMLFVISEGGDTKIIRKPHWAEFIRIVATDHAETTLEVSDGNLILKKNVKQSKNCLSASNVTDNDGDSCSDSSVLSF